MIPFKNRFHGHTSLNYLYRNGRVKRSHLVTVRMTKNTRRRHTRLAVIVPKKVAKSAVVRNRIRRRVYAFFEPWLRDDPSLIKTALDVAITVHSPEVAKMPWLELTTELQNALDWVNHQAKK